MARYHHCYDLDPADWPSRADQGWDPSTRGTSPYDNLDFDVDLGCGKLPKGRIGIDRYPAPGVAVVADLDQPRPAVFALPTVPGEDGLLTNKSMFDPEVLQHGLPFKTGSIGSVISHHALEHLGTGFIPLIDEVWRILQPGGIFRAITPLFPSWSAVSDPDHRRYFIAEDNGPCTWDSFCGTPDNCWLESFSVPYTKARFEKVDQDMSPPTPAPDMWTSRDARELRVALRACK